MNIAGKSLEEWVEFARRDDCLDRMVPSDLRQLVGAISKRRDLVYVVVEHIDYGISDTTSIWSEQAGAEDEVDRQLLKDNSPMYGFSIYEMQLDASEGGDIRLVREYPCR